MFLNGNKNFQMTSKNIIINTFKTKLEQYLHYNIKEYHQINIKFSYNPTTNKFKFLKCDSPFVHHIQNALSSELKLYI